jgi:hypothetical protein
MMKSSVWLIAIVMLFTAPAAVAQEVKKEAKPYKISTAGRQLSIRSSKPIQQVMLWTTDGNRVIEQKNINSNSFTIDIPISRKAFFLMIGLNGGKVYTEKIGMQ